MAQRGMRHTKRASEVREPRGDFGSPPLAPVRWQVEALAGFVKNTLGHSRVSIVAASDGYSTQGAIDFAKAAADDEIEVCSHLTFAYASQHAAELASLLETSVLVSWVGGRCSCTHRTGLRDCLRCGCASSVRSADQRCACVFPLAGAGRLPRCAGVRPPL